MDTVPTVLWLLAGIAVAAMVAALWDLAHHDVRHLPKWAWAAIIVAVSFPLGVIVYVVVGRVPAADTTPPRDAVDASRGGLSAPARPTLVETTPAERPPTGPPVISTAALGKSYGSTVALRDVDLVVQRGATYGLIGPNGAGKTTMLAIIAGLRRPTSGTVTLGVPRRAVGVLVDTPQFEPWLTGREVVDLARHLVAPELPYDRVAQVLGEVGLSDSATRRVGGFSRGMLQRLGLASCLVGDPDVLVLDEPSSALDPAGRREVLDLIGRLAHTKTVLLSTHILGDVQQVCDTVGVLNQGRLRFQGPLHDLLARTSSSYDLHVRNGNHGLTRMLRGQPWVSEVAELAPGRLRLVVSDAPRAERSIPRLLADAGVSLVSFNPATDLETAFLELTT